MKKTKSASNQVGRKLKLACRTEPKKRDGRAHKDRHRSDLNTKASLEQFLGAVKLIVETCISHRSHVVGNSPTNVERCGFSESAYSWAFDVDWMDRATEIELRRRSNEK